MSAIRDTSSVGQTIKGIAVRDATSLRTVQAAYGRDSASVLKTIFDGFKVTLSPDNATGYTSSPGTGYATTSGCYSTVTGGVAPYTYAWTATGGFSVLSPTLYGTAFRSSGLNPGDEADGDAYVTVTDANGATAVSNTVSLYATNTHF